MGEKARGKDRVSGRDFFIFLLRLSDSKLKGNWSRLWQTNAGHGKPLTLSLSFILPLFKGLAFMKHIVNLRV